MKYGEVSGVSYCRLSDPVNIPPNVHMLASTCFPHVFSRTLLSATSCGGFVLNILKLKLCKKKLPPLKSGRHSSFSSPLWLCFCILLYSGFVFVCQHTNTCIQDTIQTCSFSSALAICQHPISWLPNQAALPMSTVKLEQAALGR